MKKSKKNKSAKAAKPAKKKSLLSGAAKSIKKLSKGKTLGKLSTTQKVVGGTALVALGLGYLARRRKGAAAPDATAPDTDPDTGAVLNSTEGASI